MIENFLAGVAFVLVLFLGAVVLMFLMFVFLEWLSGGYK